MRILLNDTAWYEQTGNLITPALSEITLPDKEICASPPPPAEVSCSSNIYFGPYSDVDCIGIGNLGCPTGTLFAVGVTQIYTNTVYKIFKYEGSGLYMLENDFFDPYNQYRGRFPRDGRYTIHGDFTHVGRIGIGRAVTIPTSIAKEPGFHSTAEPRVTLSGQVVPGAGGYNYRTLSLDCRYKIDKFAMEQIILGKDQIGQGYPFFIDLSDESYKLPFSKLYANEKNQQSWTFQGGIRRFLYSRKFDFEERF